MDEEFMEGLKKRSDEQMERIKGVSERMWERWEKGVVGTMNSFIKE